MTASGARYPPARPNHRLRPMRASVRRISEANKTMMAIPRNGTIIESSDRSASNPAHVATPYSDTIIRIPTRMCPARVPRTTIRHWYTTTATTTDR